MNLRGRKHKDVTLIHAKGTLHFNEDGFKIILKKNMLSIYRYSIYIWIDIEFDFGNANFLIDSFHYKKNAEELVDLIMDYVYLGRTNANEYTVINGHRDIINKDKEEYSNKKSLFRRLFKK